MNNGTGSVSQVSVSTVVLMHNHDTTLIRIFIRKLMVFIRKLIVFIRI